MDSIEVLEGELEDPDQLELAFRVDHALARILRWTYSQMLLAGAPLPHAPQSMEIPDVLRGGLAAISSFDRVEILVSQQTPRVLLPGHLTPYVQHMISELTENATEFSARPVTLQADCVDDHLVIEVLDYGIGLSEGRLQALNQMLRTPGAARSQEFHNGSIGLLTTALCAERNGLRVELLSNSLSLVGSKNEQPAGVRARVVVPGRLLLTEPTTTPHLPPLAPTKRPEAAAAPPLPTRRRQSHPEGVAESAPHPTPPAHHESSRPPLPQRPTSAGPDGAAHRTDPLPEPSVTFTANLNKHLKHSTESAPFKQT
ncbi:ATP-binding protein [Streptomyces noursei]|uniref:ATP-binding protein n=1 Tax=Streptomyces noursei TaxID=1971 RepID=UPI0011AFBBB5|nr:ATP-binding protein [Streptomyces noursei]